MSIKKFRFVSPGIFINEIDNSQLPKAATEVGPVIIGRTERGPGMRPVRVNSFSDFVETFGNPIPGGSGGDVWRDGNYTAPTYAAYAAQAWLKNAAPCTVVRLLGTQHDDENGGVAGWNTGAGLAYGLFISAYDSTEGTETTNKKAALAAVIYTTDDTKLGLVGTSPDAGALTSGSDAFSCGAWCISQGQDYEFKINVGGSSKVFNFNRNSRKFIRNALNTNPTLTNDATVEHEVAYFVGETYERHLEDLLADAGDGTGEAIACLLPLNGGTSNILDKDEMNIQAQSAITSWIFSQHTGDYSEHKIQAVSGTYASDVTNLIRFHGLDDGAWASKNLKLSIADIKAGDDFDPYGSFTVILRKTNDSDNSPKYVERFTGCNLNPSSSNYVSKKIGDMYTTWDYAGSRYRTYGQYVNMSKFIRVQVAADVESASTDPSLLPFGFYGPAVPRPVTTGNTATAPVAITITGSTASAAIPVAMPANAAASLDDDASASGSPYYSGTAPTFDLIWPTMTTRTASVSGDLSSGKEAFFGASSNASGGILEDKAYADLVKPYSEGHSTGATIENGTAGVDAYPSLSCNGVFATNGYTSATGTSAEKGDVHGYDKHVVAFTLDDLTMVQLGTSGSYSMSEEHTEWKPGARLSGASITASGNDKDKYFSGGTVVGTKTYEGTYKDVLEHGFDQFTVPLFGGTDGLDVTESEPFRNSRLQDGTPLNNYAYNSVKRAIDSCSDPEVVEMNLAVMPGITNHGLTAHLINTCENRADALAIIDLKDDYKPNTEGTAEESARVPTVDAAVKTFKERGISSSYACAYFPWVQIRDTINDAMLWAPSSIVALGTMASSQRKTEVWFAPAGFNRGGLTEGSAGIPVTQARVRLTSKDRDKLYEANINPIATFPSEGLVIFGQKTLQVTPSALDRINVRRLMIYLKKEVSRISTTILFDNNVQETWNRFLGKVEPLLASVKTRYGLTEFRVILDETTTTPDLIDRNILYAKVFLKPARAIEFIAIDFVITNTGASFDD